MEGKQRKAGLGDMQIVKMLVFQETFLIGWKRVANPLLELGNPSIGHFAIDREPGRRSLLVFFTCHFRLDLASLPGRLFSP